MNGLSEQRTDDLSICQKRTHTEIQTNCFVAFAPEKQTEREKEKRSRKKKCVTSQKEMFAEAIVKMCNANALIDMQNSASSQKMLCNVSAIKPCKKSLHSNGETILKYSDAIH